MIRIRYLIICSISVFFTAYISGQQYYDIKIAGKKYQKKCHECLSLINNKPKEIQFGIQRDEYDNLFFYVTRKEWFDQMFKKGSDGIAIDIVSRDRYDCDAGKPDRSKVIRGELQPPVYRKELEQNMLPSQHGGVLIKMGTVPDKFRNKEIEFNIVFIKNKNLCYYNSFYDLKTYRWNLLDMGLYFDTLTYKSEFDTALSEQEKYILQQKILRFDIPFERNKSEYSAEDIKPLYDSLELTDYNIRKITIRAYSSIEGDEDRNIQLQQERAQSIVDALQACQKPSITTEIKASENWVDFLNEITYTKFSYLADLSKDEIRDKLKDKKLEQKLEPVLSKCRKAVVILELQKKDRFENVPVTQLLVIFKRSISENDLRQAIDIQNSIFEKVRDHDLPISLIDKLEIPEKSEFSILLDKNSVFKYLMSEADVYDTYKELNRLKELLPKDVHISYNICALKFKIWLLGQSAVDPDGFKKEILDLDRQGIPQSLVKRMLVNYEIVMCEYYMSQGDFANKDKALRYIYSNYRYIPLSDADYLSLAQYFASYARYDWATKLLYRKVRSVDVNEDLLFYYLNLTLIDQKMTRRSDYRTILLNAYDIDKKRFCGLFDTYGSGGITFQLLENDYLRRTYCESCQGSAKE